MTLLQFEPAHARNEAEDTGCGGQLNPKVSFAPHLRHRVFIRDDEHFQSFIRENMGYAVPAPDESLLFQLLYNSTLTNETILVEFAYEDHPTEPLVEITNLLEVTYEHQRRFWSRVAEHNDLQSMVFELPPGKKILVGGRYTNQVHISAPVIAKLIVKHGVDFDTLTDVLSEVKYTSYAHGMYRSDVHVNGRTYMVCFGLDTYGQVRLSTIFPKNYTRLALQPGWDPGRRP